MVSLPTVEHPADSYAPAADLALLTTYFNPAGFETKRRNYDRFRAPVERGGLFLLTVECVFGDAPFELPDDRSVLRVRGGDVMWQKERLLNLACAALPDRCTKVVWVDADILFTNRYWAAETSAALDEWALVQPFETAIRLARGSSSGAAIESQSRGFASVLVGEGGIPDGEYAEHGHTGFAWAARRNLLEPLGLYDACVLGGGDHVMAHSACADWGAACMDSMVPDPQWDHFIAWGERFSEAIAGRVGFIPGAALHLWHGEPERRQHSRRHRVLKRFGFDPHRDLRLGPSGCWEWAGDKPELRQWAIDYFAERREDGDPD